MSDGFIKARRMDPAAACAGKERFETFELANRVARRRRKNDRVGRPYRCLACGGYHLGDLLGRRRMRARHRHRRMEEA